jgi:hypothetical protein
MSEVKTKLYISRYSNKDLAKSQAVKVGITRGEPRFKLSFSLKGNITLLAPPRSIFNMTDKAAFRRKYFEYLDGVGVSEAKRVLEQFGYGVEKEMVLLCYEDTTCDDPRKNWCHRTMFAEWWAKNTGQIVEEYPDSGNFESKRKKEKPKTQMEIDQLELLF